MGSRLSIQAEKIMLGRTVQRALVRNKDNVTSRSKTAAIAALSNAGCQSKRSYGNQSHYIFYPNHKNPLLGLTTARYASSGADLPSHELVKLPALSPTMEQGTIVTFPNLNLMNHQLLKVKHPQLHHQQHQLHRRHHHLKLPHLLLHPRPSLSHQFLQQSLEKVLELLLVPQRRN